MKKLFFGIVAVLISVVSFGQETTAKKVNASIGIELASPVGDFGDYWNFGFGGTAQIEYFAAKQVGLTLNSGYILFPGKTINNSKVPNYGQLPILAGARYYFIKDIYLSGQLGTSIFFRKNAESTAAFTYAPGIGIKVSLIDMTLKYMGSSRNNLDRNNVSLRVAVWF